VVIRPDETVRIDNPALAKRAIWLESRRWVRDKKPTVNAEAIIAPIMSIAYGRLIPTIAKK
jgi:hypothetical protein